MNGDSLFTSIKKSYFFIKRTVNSRFFCSKCGKPILFDRYNMKKHIALCGHDEDEFILAYLKENEEFYYYLDYTPDTLELRIVTPRLINRPGFKDDYIGGELATVFEAVLHAEEQRIDLLCTEMGDLDRWLILIQYGLVKPVYQTDDIECIRRVFPKVPDIYSLCMFVHIYKTKGFLYRNLIKEGTEPKYITIKNTVGMPSDRNVMYIQSCIHELDQDLLLELLLRKTDSSESFRLLVSEKYVYVDRTIKLNNWFYYDCELAEGVEDDIRRFDARYPSFGLKNYWSNGGRNILLPLLSGEYHKGIELLSKSGCVDAAHCSNLKELNNDPASYRNVGELMGVPISVVKKVGAYCFDLNRRFSSFLRLSVVWKYKRRFLELEQYSWNMLEFLLENILYTGNPIAYSELIGDFTDDQICQILKYLSEGREINYLEYLDYLRLCVRANEYPYGLTPRDPFRAHDAMIERFRMGVFERNWVREQKFRRVVTGDGYLQLTTTYPEEENPFKTEKYAIVAPGRTQDLWEESQKMHHCVSMYTDFVTDGLTRIYFLRETARINVPFGTIEVKGNRILQVKAACNARVPHEAQVFVCRWAAIKHLEIKTTDINVRIA